MCNYCKAAIELQKKKPVVFTSTLASGAENSSIAVSASGVVQPPKKAQKKTVFRLTGTNITQSTSTETVEVSAEKMPAAEPAKFGRYHIEGIDNEDEDLSDER